MIANKWIQTRTARDVVHILLGGGDRLVGARDVLEGWHEGKRSEVNLIARVAGFEVRLCEAVH